MTDLATRPGADETTVDGEVKPAVDAPKPLDDGTDAPPPAYEWASTEPAPRRRRLWLWIAIPIAVVAVGLGITSLVLIAPGTSVAGVPVGGLTPGAAVEAVQQHLADTTIVLTGSGADATVTGADLGASVDARALVNEAFAAHPAWNFGAWFASPVHAEVAVDTATAVAALRAAVPSLYVDPTDATVAYDPASASYVATPAVDGAGVDVEAVRAALQDAFVAGDLTVDLAATTAAVDPEIPTYVANATVGTLNTMLDTAGFYVGAERTVPIDRATLASWLTVTRTRGRHVRDHRRRTADPAGGRRTHRSRRPGGRRRHGDRQRIRDGAAHAHGRRDGPGARDDGRHRRRVRIAARHRQRRLPAPRRRRSRSTRRPSSDCSRST